MANYDVIVLGLGGMGSSTSYQLAKQGLHVLGIEQFSEAHALGSSHGKTRLIRKAYFEHPDYVPLLQKSYELWHEIEEFSQEKLLHITGLTVFGNPDSQIIKGIKSSRDAFNLPVNEISSAEAQRWNKTFMVPQGFVGLEEPGAGFLEVEKCIVAYLKVARRLGAKLKFQEPCLSWGADSSGVWVQTAKEKYSAKKLVMTVGAWTSQVIEELKLKLEIRRVPQFWFQGKNSFDVSEIQTCFAFDMPYGFIYGFPRFSNSRDIKVAIHKPGARVSDPNQIDRQLTSLDHQWVSQFLADVLPDLDPIPTEGSVCMYTMTPDEHFVIDQHPRFDHVFLAAGFSGHGFKFAPVVGKMASDWAVGSKDLELKHFLRFRPNLF